MISAVVPFSLIAGDARLSLAPRDYIVDLSSYARREASARRTLGRAVAALQRIAAEGGAAVERAVASGVIQTGVETTRARHANTERGRQQ